MVLLCLPMLCYVLLWFCSVFLWLVLLLGCCYYFLWFGCVVLSFCFSFRSFVVIFCGFAMFSSGFVVFSCVFANVCCSRFSHRGSGTISNDRDCWIRKGLRRQGAYTSAAVLAGLSTDRSTSRELEMTQPFHHLRAVCGGRQNPPAPSER